MDPDRHTDLPYSPMTVTAVHFVHLTISVRNLEFNPPVIMSRFRSNFKPSAKKSRWNFVGVTMMCDKELLNMKTCKQFFIFQK